ncbi:MAG: hypothetical protein RR356_07575, partial [Bacteroidales bacterium]
MNRLNIIISIFISALLLSLASCEKQWEEPKFEVPIYKGKANKTVADIISKLTVGQLDSICSSTDKFIVEAV